MRKRWLSMALAAVMTASLLAGCGGGGSTAATTAAGEETTTAAGSEAGSEAAGGEETPAGEEAADRGNSIVYAIDAEPETLDPGMCNYNKSSAVLLNLFNGLYRFSDDGSNVEPAMAGLYLYLKGRLKVVGRLCADGC